MAANLMRALDLGRLEAGLISLLDPPFGTDLQESFSREGGTPVHHLGKCLDFDSRTFVRLTRALDGIGHYVDAALSIHMQGLERRAPSLDKHQETH